MRVCVALVLLLTAMPLSAQADDVLERATERRERAEADLAAFRARKIADETAMQREINELYSQLESARAQADASSAALSDAKRRQAEVTQRARQAEQAVRDLCETLGADATGSGAVPAAIADRLEELEQAVRIVRSERAVFGRNGRLSQVPVISFGHALVIACGGDANTQGFVDLSSNRILGPAFLPAMQAAIGSDNPDILPFDLTGLSLRALNMEETRSLSSWFEAGGVFMWPILVLAAIGLALCGERLFTLVVSWPRIRARAIRMLGDAHNIHDADMRESLIESALIAEEPRLERSMTLLAAVAAIAPLLGLLGTVTGMIGTFNVISVEGVGDAHGLSGGISVALITTEFGLMVAVPAILLHALFRRTIERREANLEALAEAARAGNGVETAPIERHAEKTHV